MRTNDYAITLIFVFCIIILQACTDNSSGFENGEKIEITGTINAPDGSTPLSGATVFIPKSVHNKAAAGKAEIYTSPVEAAGCHEPVEAYSTFTCTQADGSFTFDIAIFSEQTILKVSKGIFSFEQGINITETGANLGAIVMPGSKENFNGEIAVVRGSFDQMQNILAKVGFGEIETVEGVSGEGQLVPGTEEFDLLNSPDVFFEDQDDDGEKNLFNYDIVFINCGASETSIASFKEHSHRHAAQKGSINQSSILNEENRTVLKTFVEEGGVLYTTDWAYDYIEQTFPSYIDFYGEDEVVAGEPEGLNVAEVGSADIETDGNIKQNNLQAWLTNVDCYDGGSCLDNNGTIHITDFLLDWAVVESPNDGANVTTWIDGDVQWSEGSGVRPLTLSFKVGEGRVFYSSYHTVESEHTPNWRPQERILQYLVFE